MKKTIKTLIPIVGKVTKCATTWGRCLIRIGPLVMTGDGDALGNWAFNLQEEEVMCCQCPDKAWSVTVQ